MQIAGLIILKILISGAYIANHGDNIIGINRSILVQRHSMITSTLISRHL
jgi:hypothetical protein